MSLYAGFVARIADRFDQALSEIEAQHNFELGSEFEMAICRTLQRVAEAAFSRANRKHNAWRGLRYYS